MKIGVFDSGIGGKSVARAVEKALPDAEVLFANDAKHVPYGTKAPDVIYGYITPILQNLADQQCDAIVIACNTVSTTLVSRLRKDFSIPLVALEPMVKPAATLTKTGKIAVCATPTTLASERYAWLKREYASNIQVFEPDCSDWAYLIEHNQINETHIRTQIGPLLDVGVDVLVLGCTHYHWIEEEIAAVAGEGVTILQPETAVVAQLKRVLGL